MALRDAFRRQTEPAVSPSEAVDHSHLGAFVRESNKIEGITRAPNEAELLAHVVFLNRPVLDVGALVDFVALVQPNARLRNRRGLNVYVGNHVPPAGCPEISDMAAEIIARAMTADADPWRVHCEYETLHPFTDGNGRSGRVLWLWMMLRGGRDPYALQRGFLHTFYYQTLSHGEHRLGGATKPGFAPEGASQPPASLSAEGRQPDSEAVGRPTEPKDTPNV